MTEQRKFKRPRMWTHPRILFRRMLMAWPFLVWLSAIGVVLYLQSELVQYGNLTGVVYTEEQAVAPPETARLLSIDVAIGQQVKSGDVVARMDTALLDARIAAEAAATIESEEALTRYQESFLRMASQFQSAVTDAEADLQSEKLQLARAEAELAELNRELARREQLLKQRLIREEEVALLRPQIAALTKAVEQYPALIDVRQRALDATVRELADMRKWLRIEDDDSISDAITQKGDLRRTVLAKQAEVRELQRDAYILRAARDGEVSRIYHLPGEVIPGGEQILRVVSRTPRYVVGFLRETQRTMVSVGEQVAVWRQADGRDQVPGVIESISPEVQTLPGLVSPLRGQVVRGRRMMIRLVGEHDLIPGESVQIVSRGPQWVRLLRDAIGRLGRPQKQAE